MTVLVQAVQVPLAVQVSAEHGGRWTSLRGGGREWLWQRDEPRRAHVRPGDPFADAGGLEECVPTVRGLPDHGDAWSRPWIAAAAVGPAAAGASDAGLIHSVECPDFMLTRHIEVQAGAVVANYRLVAEPGYRFVWAGHALLELSAHALLNLPQGPADQSPNTRLFPEAAPYLHQPWPPGADWIEGKWPAPAGLCLDTLGPDDGTAVGAVMYRPAADSALSAADSVSTAVVDDGPDRLQLTVQSQGQPTAIALWRNLGAFPEHGPYRSIGVEPMLGRVFDLAQARDDGDCAVTPASGEVCWRLTITAYRWTEGAGNP